VVFSNFILKFLEKLHSHKFGHFPETFFKSFESKMTCVCMCVTINEVLPFTAVAVISVCHGVRL